MTGAIRGLTSREISAHFAEVYGGSVSKDTVTRITDKVLDEMAGWWSCPVERVYAAVFTDVINVKARDGQVDPKPFYAANSRGSQPKVRASSGSPRYHIERSTT